MCTARVLQAGDKVLYSDLVLENGEPLDPPPPIVIMLHKPTGYVTTSPEDKAISDPVVYDLLPYRYMCVCACHPCMRHQRGLPSPAPRYGVVPDVCAINGPARS